MSQLTESIQVVEQFQLADTIVRSYAAVNATSQLIQHPSVPAHVGSDETEPGAEAGDVLLLQ